MTAAVSPDLASLWLATPAGERAFRHRDSPADRAVIQQCFVQPQYACPGVHGRAIDAGYAAVLQHGISCSTPRTCSRSTAPGCGRRLGRSN